jgi:hypothetical protein
LKDLDQGEIVITGEPSMKPYDQVFLYDSYNDMSGSLEVEQVTHIFSQETGFLTVIVPDLAEGDLFPKWPSISRPSRSSAHLLGCFYFVTSRLHFLFLAKIWGFWVHIKE